NELGQSDYVSQQQSADNVAHKAEAFGFVVRSINGHDPDQIRDALAALPVIQNGNRPFAIVARTVKGWGAAAEQGMGKHGTPVKKDKMSEVLSQLDKTAKELGVTDYKIAGELTISSPSDPRFQISNFKPIKISDFKEGLAAVGLDKDFS